MPDMPTNKTPGALGEEALDIALVLRTARPGSEYRIAYLALEAAINQLRDMAASGAKDAERYQWLRDSRRIPRDDDPERHAVIVAPGGEDVLWGASLDATCDAAIAATKRGGA